MVKPKNVFNYNLLTKSFFYSLLSSSSFSVLFFNRNNIFFAISINCLIRQMRARARISEYKFIINLLIIRNRPNSRTKTNIPHAKTKKANQIKNNKVKYKAFCFEYRLKQHYCSIMKNKNNNYCFHKISQLTNWNPAYFTKVAKAKNSTNINGLMWNVRRLVRS